MSAPPVNPVGLMATSACVRTSRATNPPVVESGERVSADLAAVFSVNRPGDGRTPRRPIDARRRGAW